jgi:hypothetical protein
LQFDAMRNARPKIKTGLARRFKNAKYNLTINQLRDARFQYAQRDVWMRKRSVECERIRCACVRNNPQAAGICRFGARNDSQERVF